MLPSFLARRPRVDENFFPFFCCLPEASLSAESGKYVVCQFFQTMLKSPDQFRVKKKSGSSGDEFPPSFPLSFSCFFPQPLK